MVFDSSKKFTRSNQEINEDILSSSDDSDSDNDEDDSELPDDLERRETLYEIARKQLDLKKNDATNQTLLQDMQNTQNTPDKFTTPELKKVLGRSRSSLTRLTSGKSKKRQTKKSKKTETK